MKLPALVMSVMAVFLECRNIFLRTFSDFDFPYVIKTHFGNWSDNDNLFAIFDKILFLKLLRVSARFPLPQLKRV